MAAKDTIPRMTRRPTFTFVLLAAKGGNLGFGLAGVQEALDVGMGRAPHLRR